MQAFCDPDYYDLHISKIDILIEEVNILIATLTTLIPYLQQESLFYWSLMGIDKDLTLVVEMFRLMLQELAHMRISFAAIKHNLTHSKYVLHLKGPLESKVTVNHFLTLLHFTF